MITVAVWTIIPGLKLPVPRSADPIATIANCSAIAGTIQRRYSIGLRRGALIGAHQRAYGAAQRPG